MRFKVDENLHVGVTDLLLLVHVCPLQHRHPHFQRLLKAIR